MCLCSQEGATLLDPGTRTFSDLPAWLEAHQAELAGRRVLMYCTGGVRCERASAHLRSLGACFRGDSVVQLQGERGATAGQRVLLSLSLAPKACRVVAPDLCVVLYRCHGTPACCVLHVQLPQGRAETLDTTTVQAPRVEAVQAA